MRLLLAAMFVAGMEAAVDRVHMHLGADPATWTQSVAEHDSGDDRGNSCEHCTHVSSLVGQSVGLSTAGFTPEPNSSRSRDDAPSDAYPTALIRPPIA